MDMEYYYTRTKYTTITCSRADLAINTIAREFYSI